MDEFLKELHIDMEGEYLDNGSYQIELLDSDEYSNVYYNLDDLDFLTLDEDKLLMSEDMNTIVYDTDKYEVTLIGDFNRDVYRILIKEI